ncbi:hypothetical protein EHN07_03780 [Buttiauxella warmboldiae]|uniref:Uncharacterized protein n=1 Tax=Buttiauxella warmboldiae TaxID=82993 RepID=A0A3N5EG20_9ENTR|nr:hypothetical protein EHN07_03780 [Buttiauxella warmboldiae]
MPVSVVGVNISKTGNYTILITVSGSGYVDSQELRMINSPNLSFTASDPYKHASFQLSQLICISHDLI